MVVNDICYNMMYDCVEMGIYNGLIIKIVVLT